MDLNSTWFEVFLPKLVQQGPIPKHVGFIMDGNRRYAKERNISIEKAYYTGSQALENVLESCFTAGIQVVTVYAFSLANFQRSEEEIKHVMDIVNVGVSRLLQPGNIAERFGAKLRMSGNKSLLPKETIQALENADRIVGKNANCVVNVCLAYGSRDEIATAIKKAVLRHSHGLSTDDQSNNPCNSEMFEISRQGSTRDWAFSGNITIEELEDEMFTAGLPPLDLLVRTSGTNRLSDFMLWQCHQVTDIVIEEKNWPDFKCWEIFQTLAGWQWRNSWSNFNVPALETPSVFRILMNYVYLVILAFVRASSVVHWYSHAISTKIDHRGHGQEGIPLKEIQKNSAGLKQLPSHLSIIVNLTSDLDTLDMTLVTIADIMIWCICMGIPLLSVYERTGKLKSKRDSLHQIVTARLQHHYGARQSDFNVLTSKIAQQQPTKTCGPGSFSLLLLSAQDGRDSLAEIANDLVRSVRRGKISPEAIDAKQVDRMLKSKLLVSLDQTSNPGTGLPDTKELLPDPSERALHYDNRRAISQRILDPDVLFVFGSRIQFDGYPPWQLCSTEIFCAGEDSTGFGKRSVTSRYRIFLQGLYSFAGAEIKSGK